MTAAELRAMIAGATPGEWSITADPLSDAPMEMGYLGCESYEITNRKGAKWTAHTQTVANSALIVALRNHAEKFAELLEREEVGIWSAPIDGKVWLNLHRGKEHVGVIIYRKSENDYYWNAMGCGNHCSTEAEARAAVEAAVRAGR